MGEHKEGWLGNEERKRAAIPLPLLLLALLLHILRLMTVKTSLVFH